MLQLRSVAQGREERGVYLSGKPEKFKNFSGYVAHLCEAHRSYTERVLAKNFTAINIARMQMYLRALQRFNIVDPLSARFVTIFRGWQKVE